MTSWATALSALTLVVEDLAAARRFYDDAFGLPVAFEDEESVAYRLGGSVVNLLAAPAADELVSPAPVGAPGLGVRAVMTVGVDDVDARCAALAERGVSLLNGPVDRPWGVRTASFADPAGHVWEISGPPLS